MMCHNYTLLALIILYQLGSYLLIVTGERIYVLPTDKLENLKVASNHYQKYLNVKNGKFKA